jgi:alanyl-tRNA synthetase
LESAEEIKNMMFELRGQVDNLVCVLGAEINGKASLSVILSDNLVNDKNMNANNMVRELSKDIQGGGGGQAFYATAGGTNPAGLEAAVKKASGFLN